eukprot:76018-Prymnesium_polylepis.3
MSLRSERWSGLAQIRSRLKAAIVLKCMDCLAPFAKGTTEYLLVPASQTSTNLAILFQVACTGVRLSKR